MSFEITSQSSALRCEVCHKNPPVDDIADRCPRCAELGQNSLQLQKIAEFQSEVSRINKLREYESARKKAVYSLEKRFRTETNIVHKNFPSDQDLYDVIKLELPKMSILWAHAIPGVAVILGLITITFAQLIIPGIALTTIFGIILITGLLEEDCTCQQKMAFKKFVRLYEARQNTSEQS